MEKKKLRRVLKQGTWTNIVFDEFYKKFNLPCCFVFKRCKILSTSADNFLKIFAKCKDSTRNENLYAYAKRKPLEDEPLKLKVITLDTSNVPHDTTYKRHI